MSDVLTTNSADGNLISYGISGEGQTTLVFIHGWTCNHTFWQHQLESFSDRYKIVWLDLAGHGLSASDRENYSIKSFAEDVIAVVNTIQDKNIVLVGHSLGGAIAIEAAKVLDDKLLDIIAVDTFYTPFPYPESEQGIKELMQPFEDNYADTLNNLVRSLFNSEVDPELVNSILTQMSAVDKQISISTLTSVLYWHIDNMPASLNKFYERLHHINGTPTPPGSPDNITLIADAGHFVAQVVPGIFDEILLKILTRRSEK
jgi:pimeloyl-ACP methyl ester carboxylesterase